MVQLLRRVTISEAYRVFDDEAGAGLMLVLRDRLNESSVRVSEKHADLVDRAHGERQLVDVMELPSGEFDIRVSPPRDGYEHWCESGCGRVRLVGRECPCHYEARRIAHGDSPPRRVNRFVVAGMRTGKHETMQRLRAMGFVDRDGDEGMLGFDMPRPKLDPALAHDEWRLEWDRSDPGAVAALAAGFRLMTESAQMAARVIGELNGALAPLEDAQRVRLAAWAQRTPTGNLTRRAECSRSPLKREAARVELLARMAPALLPVMRDEWDNLPDAEPDGIVRRP